MFSDFVVTMKHDHGKIRIRTVARDAETAAYLVCKAEHAPPSAVVSVKQVAR